MDATALDVNDTDHEPIVDVVKEGRVSPTELKARYEANRIAREDAVAREVAERIQAYQRKVADPRWDWSDWMLAVATFVGLAMVVSALVYESLLP